ncbi:unnamed protein product, partial [Pylaiella littoralis]
KVNTEGVTPTFLLRYMREIFSREQGSAVPTLVGEDESAFTNSIAAFKVAKVYTRKFMWSGRCVGREEGTAIRTTICVFHVIIPVLNLIFPEEVVLHIVSKSYLCAVYDEIIVEGVLHIIS